ncbi:hypothetical protein P5673_017266 [Acropora cervicornis]|uniref:Uncharacterized protein n=1 Tax=Acropora cervicornis TaxID=6130 RepID=A0AAD9QG70_ACRCE|nr:hypothetical protein P5673_017266 [Acropora cervicornis]
MATTKKPSTQWRRKWTEDQNS